MKLPRSRKAGVLWLLLLLVNHLGAADGRAETLRELDVVGEPDRRCHVVLYRSRSGDFLYRILRRGSRRPLLDLTGWYSHPDPDELPHWSENHAGDAQVYWNGDGSLVALDERAHRYEGTVFVARRRRDGRFKKVTLPEKAVLAATGCRWERQRLGRPEWEGHRRLNLDLVGRLEGGGGEYHTFQVVLEINPAGAVRIESARERPE